MLFWTRFILTYLALSTLDYTLTFMSDWDRLPQMTQSNIYLDYNATTPVAPEVREKVPFWLDQWGNPSSIHFHGRGPKKLLREARRKMAESLGIHPLEMIFTSGGSESNNLALQGPLRELKNKGVKRNKVIIGGIEHPSVLNQKERIESLGYEVLILPVCCEGKYDWNFYQNNLTDEVALVSVMLANNELGVIAPIKEMTRLAHERGALFHSDCVQALGKYEFDLNDLGVDLATFSSHKVYALKGSGLLYIKKGTPFSPLILGGSQERKRRAGTENLLAIASFSYVCEHLDTSAFVDSTRALRDNFEAFLSDNIDGLKILGKQNERLSNTSCFTVDGVGAESLLMNLDIRGFSVGTGAACSSGNPEPSPVLLAIGLTREQAQSSLRISLGKMTTQEQMEEFGRNMVEVVKHLRSLDPETGEVKNV